MRQRSHASASASATMPSNVFWNTRFLSTSSTSISCCVYESSSLDPTRVRSTRHSPFVNECLSLRRTMLAEEADDVVVVVVVGSGGGGRARSLSSNLSTAMLNRAAVIVVPPPPPVSGTSTVPSTVLMPYVLLLAATSHTMRCLSLLLARDDDDDDDSQHVSCVSVLVSSHPPPAEFRKKSRTFSRHCLGTELENRLFDPPPPPPATAFPSEPNRTSNSRSSNPNLNTASPNRPAASYTPAGWGSSTP